MSLPPDRPIDLRITNERIIASLARESTASIDEVTRLYEQERAELEMGARIKRFVPILAIRNVRAALRRSGIKAAPPSVGDATRISG